MDPLSDVLSLLKPRNYFVRGFDVAAPWSIQFGRHEGIKCYAVVSGECWLCVEGVGDSVRLRAGDCLLLPRGRPFRLTSDPALTPMDAEAMISSSGNGAIAAFNGGGDCFGIGGWFAFAGPYAGILLGVLPPIVHIRKDTDRAALRWALEQMMQELREPLPGGDLVAQHLAHMVLVQALRLHLAEGSSGGVGWLFALADPQMSAAINAMHQEPALRWTLQMLAGRAGMSRSSFAQKFKATVGASPMDYLTRWRMLLAGDRLENSGDPISAIALSLGYESESAFSTAFKRVMDVSPRTYARRRNPAAPSQGERKSLHVSDGRTELPTVRRKVGSGR
ncbi:AraC family transcriptional regulator [Phenylobacterium sp.]|uniref:AraC family transcriptional regulator n=1 Tax=Phenylobacterium sp. TaxID=1871053 RepID=UPI0025D4B6BC|nr:AraC family transcriptional regulator [Phenylobacterium sp.]